MISIREHNVYCNIILHICVLFTDYNGLLIWNFSESDRKKTTDLRFTLTSAYFLNFLSSDLNSHTNDKHPFRVIRFLSNGCTHNFFFLIFKTAKSVRHIKIAISSSVDILTSNLVLYYFVLSRLTGVRRVFQTHFFSLTKQKFL